MEKAITLRVQAMRLMARQWHMDVIAGRKAAPREFRESLKELFDVLLIAEARLREGPTKVHIVRQAHDWGAVYVDGVRHQTGHPDDWVADIEDMLSFVKQCAGADLYIVDDPDCLLQRDTPFGQRTRKFFVETLPDSLPVGVTVTEV